jgi:hypothetical protein
MIRCTMIRWIMIGATASKGDERGALPNLKYCNI